MHQLIQPDKITKELYDSESAWDPLTKLIQKSNSDDRKGFDRNHKRDRNQTRRWADKRPVKWRDRQDQDNKKKEKECLEKGGPLLITIARVQDI